MVFGLAGWLSCLEHCPVHQKVAGSIPGPGMYLGSGFDPQLGVFSLSLFLSLSLKSISISLGKNFKKRHGFCHLGVINM